MLTQLYYTLPEIVLLTAACVILLVDLFVKQKRLQLTYALTVITLIICMAISYSFLSQGVHDVIWHGQFVRDAFTSTLEFMTALTVLVCLIFSRGYIFEHEHMAQGEFYILAMFSLLGMMVLISAHSLLVIYLGLELTSLPLYALIAMKRQDVLAVEAAAKYFILGAIGSGLLLYGTSIVFGVTHTINIAQVAQALSAHSFDPVLLLATIFILCGIAFKLAAVPFHMWAPDVYQGAPNGVAIIVSTAPKLAAFAMLVRYMVQALGPYEVHWQPLLIVIAVLSMGIGNLLALVQSNIKRLIAYSGIAHIGYMLLGIIGGTTAGYTAAMFYILIYVLSTLAAFGVLTLISTREHEYQTIEDLRGLHYSSPWLAFMMMLVMFSMGSIPPLVGFFAKLTVIQAVIQAHLVWLAVVAIIFSIIGLFYYLNVVKKMYFERPTSGVPVIASYTQKAVLTVNSITLLALGIAPAGLLAIAHQAVAVL